jgi:class 3 adenylate cyclase
MRRHPILSNVGTLGPDPSALEVQLPRLQARSFAHSTDVRLFPHGRGEIVRLDETTVGHGTYEPGWRWTADMPAIAGTASCQLHHLGYAQSGVLHVVTDDGEALDVTAGSVYEIPPGHDAWVVGDEPFVTIDWTSARTFGIAPEVTGEGVIVTVLFTDIVESTATLHRVGDQAWRDLLLVHNARLRDQLNAFRGREIKTTGDGLLAVFDNPSRAVRCAAAMTRAARAIDLPIRVGVHTGEVVFVGEDARGLAVHTAARVMSLGGADDVLMSSTTRDLLEGSELTLEDAGEHELKGLPGMRKVFRLVEAKAQP